MTGMLPASAQLNQLRQRGLLGEADDLEVGAVDTEQQLGALSDGALVVADACAIGGSHLAQRRARLAHNLRDAERAAYFDQLAARHNHFSALGQRVQSQQNRCGVVVDDRRRGSGCRAPGGNVGREQGGKEAVHVQVAPAALAAFEIELQIAIPARHLCRVLQDGFTQRRPAQIGVQYYSGGIDDPAQRKARACLQLFGKHSRKCRDREAQLVFISVARDGLAQPLQHLAAAFDDRRASMFGGERCDSFAPREFIHGREQPEEFGAYKSFVLLLARS